MDDETTQIVQSSLASLVRHFLTTASGVLVAHGALANNQSTNFVEIGVAAAMWVVAYGWSYAQKKKTAAAIVKGP